MLLLVVHTKVAGAAAGAKVAESQGAYYEGVEDGARKCWPWLPGSGELAWVLEALPCWELFILWLHARKGYLAAAHLGLCHVLLPSNTAGCKAGFH